MDSLHGHILTYPLNSVSYRCIQIPQTHHLWNDGVHVLTHCRWYYRRFGIGIGTIDNNEHHLWGYVGAVGYPDVVLL